MDLVASVRKEGSRGGRNSFQWSDVKDSTHRENYLGHSLMAPVGRWQQKRDLTWYAKGSDDAGADAAETERQQEVRRVKEAEQDAMARALGLPAPPKAANPNLTQLGGNEVQRAIRETARDNDNDETEDPKGIGFGNFGGISGRGDTGDRSDKIEGVGLNHGADRAERRSSRRYDHDEHRSRGRSRDREKDRDRKSRRRDYDSLRYERRHKSRSRERRRDKGRDHDYRRRRSASRSRDRERKSRKNHRRSRSRSPDERREPHYERRHHDQRR